MAEIAETIQTLCDVKAGMLDLAENRIGRTEGDISARLAELAEVIGNEVEKLRSRERVLERVEVDWQVDGIETGA